MDAHKPLHAAVQFREELVQTTGIIAAGLQADIAERIFQHEVELRRADVAAQVFSRSHEEDVSLDAARLRYDGLPDDEVLQAVRAQDEFDTGIMRSPRQSPQDAPRLAERQEIWRQAADIA